MVFASVYFLFVFLPITLLLYHVVSDKFKNFILLVMSLVFYAWGEPVYIFLMILSILLNYVCGLEIEKKRDEGRNYKGSLIFSVIVNLSVLFFFKYYTFLAGSLNGILPFQIPCYELPLPIGISFYTFRILSYIIDVYRGKVKAQKNIISFSVYAAMFPQLTSRDRLYSIRM